MKNSTSGRKEKPKLRAISGFGFLYLKKRVKMYCQHEGLDFENPAQRAFAYRNVMSNVKIEYEEVE